MGNTDLKKLKSKIKKLDKEIQDTPTSKSFGTAFLKKVSKYNILVNQLKKERKRRRK